MPLFSSMTAMSSLILLLAVPGSFLSDRKGWQPSRISAAEVCRDRYGCAVGLHSSLFGLADALSPLTEQR